MFRPATLNSTLYDICRLQVNDGLRVRPREVAAKGPKNAQDIGREGENIEPERVIQP